MNNLLNTLLRAGISLSLHDREAFISKASELIQSRGLTEATTADQLSALIAEALKATGDTLLHKSIVDTSNQKLEKKIDALTAQIEELKQQLKR